MDLWIAERAIPTSKNSSDDQINAISSQELLPEEATFYAVLMCTSDPRESSRFPVEFMSKLTPAGLPPHHLYIELGVVHMLL